jgi:hypothetical protein
MLKVAMLLSSLLVTPVATDTVWWRTGGGSVVQDSSGPVQKCTLTLEEGTTRFAFVWHRGLPPAIMASQTDWNVAPNTNIPVALRIGEVWLGHGNGAPNITAATGFAAVMIVPDQPLDSLLAAADTVALRAPATQFGVQMAPGKMAALVAAARKCRSYIGVE